MRRGVVGFWFGLTVVLAGCSARRPEIEGRASRAPAVQTGIASWYGPGFHGETTSSGEVYDQHQLTAAHRTLPLGTRVEVTNLGNGRSIEVRVNDRGPFVGDRVIDLSYAAARALDMVGPGTAPVQIQVLGAARGAMPSVSYAVQAGSFTDEANARKLERALERRVDRVYVTQLEKDGRSYYRVRVGPYERREDALAAAKGITSLGFSGLIMEEAFAARR
jgi:rare lipoprotein A